MQPVMLVELATHGPRLSRAHDRAKTLCQHQRADDAEEHHIGKLDHKIDLTDFAKEREQRHPEC